MFMAVPFDLGPRLPNDSYRPDERRKPESTNRRLVALIDGAERIARDEPLSPSPIVALPTRDFSKNHLGSLADDFHVLHAKAEAGREVARTARYPRS
jgi:hypothetical protein